MMREPDRWLAVLLAIIIVATGSVLTLLSVQQEDARMRTDLLARARIAVQDIDPAAVESLAGAPADIASPEYAGLKDQLVRVRATDPAMRFTYLLGQRPDGTIVIYGDSEPPDSEAYSPPGQVYTEVPAAVVPVFMTGREITAGPYTDRWGTWVSGLTPLTGPAKGRVIAVFGMDMDAKDWNRALFAAAVPGILGTLLILVLLVSFSIVYRRSKRERSRIEQSEKVYRSLFEHTGNVTIRVEEDSTMSMVNSSFEQLTGYSRAEIEGRRKWTEFVHPDDLPRMAQYHSLRREPGGQPPVQYEFRLITKDGKEKDILLSVGLIPGTKQSIASLFDLTERKKLERAVRESEEHYQQLFDLANDGITIVQDGVILRCNAGFAVITGYPVEDLVGRSMVTVIHPGDVDVVMDRHKRRLSGEQGLPELYTFRLVSKDGAVRWVELNTRLIEWGGKPATLNIVRDITARKQTEEALYRANRKLHLLSDVTRHDVLNQLLVLQGYLNLTSEYLHDTEKLQVFITRELNSVATIERQILFTKDYQDMGIRAPAWQDLALILIHARGSLPMRGVALVQEGTGVEVLADPLFEKVFYNLIDNALKHGGDTLTAIRVSTGGREDGLAIIVEDDGAGIPAEDKPKLFTRGFGKNTGLGLFLSREILSITGITIKETGTPGKGARFEIRVPEGSYRFKDSGQR